MDHSEEWKAVEEIIQQEQDDSCLQVPWSSTGLCPCCGDELELHDTNYPVCGGGAYQLCDSCGWESEAAYDL